MTQNDFLNQQRAAVERMREMNNRSSLNNEQKRSNPPYQKAEEKNINKNTAKRVEKPISNNSPANFLENLLGDGDSTLLIGLLLILMSEKADKMLIFALVYILI